MMTNKRNTVLYVGRTDKLFRRVKQHKGQYKGFTSKYNVIKLVYYETHTSKKIAIKRERQIKNLLRKKKEELINKLNPTWKELFEETS